MPASSNENSIQNDDIPRDPPSIFGPITLPSSCWMINIIIVNHKALIGLTNRTSIIDGTAPIKGPKNGIIFVTPIINVISIR